MAVLPWRPAVPAGRPAKLKRNERRLKQARGIRRRNPGAAGWTAERGVPEYSTVGNGTAELQELKNCSTATLQAAALQNCSTMRHLRDGCSSRYSSGSSLKNGAPGRRAARGARVIGRR